MSFDLDKRGTNKKKSISERPEYQLKEGSIDPELLEHILECVTDDADRLANTSNTLLGELLRLKAILESAIGGKFPDKNSKSQFNDETSEHRCPACDRLLAKQANGRLIIKHKSQQLIVNSGPVTASCPGCSLMQEIRISR